VENGEFLLPVLYATLQMRSTHRNCRRRTQFLLLACYVPNVAKEEYMRSV